MTKTIDALNNAFKADPAAIRSLLLNQIPCNDRLADDPFVPVAVDENVDGKYYYVSALGLVNAVLMANGLPLVAGQWDLDSLPRKFVGFCEYSPQ